MHYQHSAQHMLDSMLVKEVGGSGGGGGGGGGSGGGDGGGIRTKAILIIGCRRKKGARLHHQQAEFTSQAAYLEQAHIITDKYQTVFPNPAQCFKAFSQETSDIGQIQCGLTDIAGGRAMTVWLMCSIWYSRVSMQGWVSVYPVD